MTDYKDLITLRDFIRVATSRFNEAGLYYGHGTDNAWDEAVALTLHTLHLPHDVHAAVFDARLTESERQKLAQLIDQRIHERIPLAYLTHEAWFAGLSFYIDERVLIPRSPLAELIENQFAPWLQVNDIERVLDLCTGSACIAIACANALPEAQVDASDLSKDALAVAKINVLKHEMEDQVHLYESDLYANLPKKKYNVIISNPPYVSEAEMANLPAEYRHEPALALSAGDSGIDFAVHILREAHHYLEPKGILIVEVGNSEHALQAQFPELPFTWLTFERGGDGVFLLTAEQLASKAVRAALDQ